MWPCTEIGMGVTESLTMAVANDFCIGHPRSSYFKMVKIAADFSCKTWRSAAT